MEESTEQVCLDGMNLLKKSKIFKKNSSNYENPDIDTANYTREYEKQNEVELYFLRRTDKLIQRG
ncbi:hypothetical protein, partial [Klebsiella pneumoniae]